MNGSLTFTAGEVTIPETDTDDDDDEDIEHVHTYTSEITTEVTCTEDGVITYTCTGCGDTYTETIAATGHSYDDGEVTTEPTCTEAGVMTYTCTVCGDTYTEAIAATGHSYELTSTVENDDGSITYTYTCSVCGDTYTEAIAATGHSYELTSTVENEDGSITYTYTCSVCGDTYTEVEKDYLIPSVSLTVRTNNGKIQMVATMTGYDDENYYTVTGHGFVYITKTKLGYKTLTVSTTGRTKVTVNGQTASSDGTYKYAYSLTPSSSSKVYVMRAWITYEDDDGNTQYVYSDTITATYNSLS